MYADKFCNFRKTEKFFWRNKLPKLIQTETDNMNNPTSIKETESVV